MCKNLLLGWLLAAPLATAHHGWDQVADAWGVVRGEVVAFEPGNAHAELALMVENHVWHIELGPSWRNERAGLRREMLDTGRTITVQGHRILNRPRWLKAVRVVIDGRNFDLYPDRIRRPPMRRPTPENEILG